jgi:hypothetical protein
MGRVSAFPIAIWRASPATAFSARRIQITRDPAPVSELSRQAFARS